MLLRGGPEALAITKRLVRDRARRCRRGGRCAQMTELSAERFTSEEGQEGIAAFMEKRPASWVPAEVPAATRVRRGRADGSRTR